MDDIVSALADLKAHLKAVRSYIGGSVAAAEVFGELKSALATRESLTAAAAAPTDGAPERAHAIRDALDVGDMVVEVIGDPDDVFDRIGDAISAIDRTMSDISELA